MVIRDGYYSVGAVSFVVGVLVMVTVVVPGVAYLEGLPDSAWRLKRRAKRSL